MKNVNEKINRFERRPLTTIFMIVFVSVVALDFSAAHIYRLINGYPWPERERARQEKEFRAVREIEKSYRVESAVYHHDLAKNMSVDRAAWGYLNYRICTNSMGFKDRVARNIPLRSDKRRIVFIGDSFTEGIGFSYDDTFVGLIDRALPEKGVEVFNAAVESYSPVIYWKKINYLINKAGFRFDEVVVFIDMSDIQDEVIFYFLDDNGNVLRKNESYRDLNEMMDKVEDGKINIAGKIVKSSKSLLRNNSILIYYVLNKLLFENTGDRDKASLEYHRTLWTVDKKLYDEYGAEGLEKCGLYMDKLYRLLESKGIKLTVAVYPLPGQILYDSPDSIQVTYWKKWSSEREVPFINYFPYFMTGKTPKEKREVIDRYYLKGDVHFNREGHKLIADVFLKYYKETRAINKQRR